MTSIVTPDCPATSSKDTTRLLMATVTPVTTLSQDDVRHCLDLLDMARTHLLSLANAHEQRCANTHAVDVMRQYAEHASTIRTRLLASLAK